MVASSKPNSDKFSHSAQFYFTCSSVPEFLQSMGGLEPKYNEYSGMAHSLCNGVRSDMQWAWSLYLNTNKQTTKQTNKQTKQRNKETKKQRNKETKKQRNERRTTKGEKECGGGSSRKVGTTRGGRRSKVTWEQMGGWVVANKDTNPRKLYLCLTES